MDEFWILYLGPITIANWPGTKQFRLRILPINRWVIELGPFQIMGRR